MSDPLTALMHAVQVMNLLKTLILRTLRDREETSTEGEGYSPMSFHSSDRESEEYYDSQQEMDTRGELRETKSDYDEHVEYIHNNEEEEEEEEAAFVSEIEESFLKQLNAENRKKLSEAENSCLSSTYEDESTTTLTAEGSNVDSSSPSTGSKSTNDVEMIDKFSDSFSLLPLFASS